MTYTPPLADMRFVIEHVVGRAAVQALPGCEEFAADLVDPVFEEAAKLASEVLAPLNQLGDRQGATLQGDKVTMPAGFRAAYEAYRNAGWNSVPFDPEHGGQGLPWLLAFAVQEMWQSANMAFGLCPLLNQGAVEAIATHGSAEQKALYLPRLISGEWTGTMNLTESQAGSDLGQIRSKAVRDGDRFRLFGQKIYITYGEHDLAENIVHMVLARIEGAPEGVKGISLFIAPKFLPDTGERNDLACVSIEHKLGIHASPTCTMQFGDVMDDRGGAIAWLVGEENRGLEYMFTMMNNARLSVGLQGVAIAERAYQQALAYAQGRVQGKTLFTGGTIFDHPDVRRMLLHMKALVAAGRGLCYYAAAQLDIARRSGDVAAQSRVDLLTPIVKAWCTDIGCEVATLGIQVHGGMGYVEETGAAQHLRDARIAPIYEGTNGIQAGDLVFRKTVRDKGVAAMAFVEEMKGLARQAHENEAAARIGYELELALEPLEIAIGWMAQTPAIEAASGAYSYLTLFGIVAGGYVLAKAALASTDDRDGMARRAMAEYYADVILCRAESLRVAVTGTHGSLSAMPADAY